MASDQLNNMTGSVANHTVLYIKYLYTRVHTARLLQVYVAMIQHHHRWQQFLPLVIDAVDITILNTTIFFLITYLSTLSSLTSWGDFLRLPLLDDLNAQKMLNMIHEFPCEISNLYPASKLAKFHHANIL